MTIDKSMNVILIGIDTLRYDHLGFAGYHRNTSPYIDALTKESLVFHNCFSQAPSTGPSFASIFTSRYPTFHGVINVWTRNRGWSLAENVPTLQEILKSNGYATAAFTEGGTLMPHIGLAKGFDVYETTASSLTDARKHPAVQWMKEKKERPFFLFFQTFATHAPYITPTTSKDMDDPNYNGRFPANIAEVLKSGAVDKTFRKIMEEVKHIPKEIERLKKMYDACITYMDHFIGQLLEEMRTFGLEQNTIIVLTSDHGEEFMEHGNIYHQNIYDEILHVPLVIKVPLARTQKNINQIVRSIDITPTVLDLLNIQTEETLQGTSLLPTTEGIDLNLVSLAEHGYKYFSLRSKYYKYIYRKKTEQEVYSVVSDPAEKDDVSTYSPALVEKLHNEFQTELTHKKLIRPPHKMFILKNGQTIGKIKSTSHVDTP